MTRDYGHRQHRWDNGHCHVCGARRCQAAACDLEAQSGLLFCSQHLTRGYMVYSTAAQHVAEIVLQPHKCGPDCLCWQIRRIAAVNEEVTNLHLAKIQTQKQTGTG